MVAGLAAKAPTEPLPAWRDRVFILEREQRSLVGQLIARPERFSLLRLVGVDHLDGTARSVYGALCRLRARAVPWSWVDRRPLCAEVARVGIDPCVVDDWAAEWEDNPTRLSDLEAALEHAYLRRRLDTAGRVLVEVARDPVGDIEVLRVTTRHLRDDLGDVLARGERR